MTSARRTRQLRGQSGQAFEVCDIRSGKRPCKPLNRIWLLNPDADVYSSWSACSCGRRFPLKRRSLPEQVAIAVRKRTRPRQALGAEDLTLIAEQMWAANRESNFAKPGVVPVGVQVLHKPTNFVDPTARSELITISHRLIETMHSASGIGLAANQVGAPVRILVHNLPAVAPFALLNPEVLAVEDAWIYEEGCLSLHVAETRAPVRRPKILTVVADLLDGNLVAMVADELLSRVLQHEIDHLEGIEYVQRLVGQERDRVYEVMKQAGVDVNWLPSRPYDEGDFEVAYKPPD